MGQYPAPADYLECKFIGDFKGFPIEIIVDLNICQKLPESIAPDPSLRLNTIFHDVGNILNPTIRWKFIKYCSWKLV
jgi:hypothetical protein